MKCPVHKDPGIGGDTIDRNSRRRKERGSFSHRRSTGIVKVLFKQRRIRKPELGKMDTRFGWRELHRLGGTPGHAIVIAYQVVAFQTMGGTVPSSGHYARKRTQDYNSVLNREKMDSFDVVLC